VALSLIPKNYYLLLGLYSLIGFCFPSIAYSSLYLNEVGDDNMRSIGTNIISFGWVAGELFFIGIAYEV
jgi:hypothetical protein